VWAVYAREIDYSSEVKSPIEWMLLTTVEVSIFREAVERLAWYARRWGIEVYHRTLKSGCRVEDRRLNNVDRIEACLAIDLVVAWRIYWLTKQGRETPDISCDNFLSEDEWKALCAYVRKEP
jgi:IS4 transposase